MQSQQAGLVLQAFIGKHTKLKSAMNQNRTKTKTKPKNKNKKSLSLTLNATAANPGHDDTRPTGRRAEDAGGDAIV